MNTRHWDTSQRVVLDTYRSHECVSILGAPGTGKTALLEELAACEIEAGARVVFLVQDRRAATDSLLRLTRRCGALSADVSVRSLSAFCYSIVQEFAEQTGRVRPELVSGAEQDARLREIISEGV
ncbi:MAG: ATP-binding protein, partial [Actinomycetaceae bacterium]|nr:ATP-binding protein [Actinomycetaceae bacterium]